MATSGSWMLNVGRRLVLVQVQVLSHSADLSVTLVAVAERATAALLLVMQLDCAEKSLFSHDATTFFAPMKAMPLGDVKFTVIAPLTQPTVAWPACTKLLQARCRAPPLLLLVEQFCAWRRGKGGEWVLGTGIKETQGGCLGGGGGGGGGAARRGAAGRGGARRRRRRGAPWR
jgi:hypothetical protein